MVGLILTNGILAMAFLAANAWLFQEWRQPAVLFTLGWNAGMALGLAAMIAALAVCGLT